MNLTTFELDMVVSEYDADGSLSGQLDFAAFD